MYLRGRPVSLYAPSELIDSYDISKVTTPPQARLKLEWVYPFHTIKTDICFVRRKFVVAGFL